MRKRRAILIDDDPFMLDMLKQLFEFRGYEVVAYGEPVCCPGYDGQARCDTMRPCGDILITDYSVPGMSGLELLREQVKMGCKITMKNKAVISGYLDDAVVAALDTMGCAYFNKPFIFPELVTWVSGCEQRMDLTMPLGFKRKESRQNCSSEVTFQLERSDILCRADVVNRSRSGLCVRVQHPLAVDQRLYLRTGIPLSSGCLLVCWTRPASEGGYFAGMSCC